jgi:hypothetical protein
MSEKNNLIGVIDQPSNLDYIVACLVCGNQKPVMMYPHRIDNIIVGWVFVCADDEKRVQGALVEWKFDQQSEAENG